MVSPSTFLPGETGLPKLALTVTWHLVNKVVATVSSTLPSQPWPRAPRPSAEIRKRGFKTCMPILLMPDLLLSGG